MSEHQTSEPAGRRSLGGRLMKVVDATPTHRWAAAAVAVVLGATVFWAGTVGRAPTPNQLLHVECTVGLAPAATDRLDLHWKEVAAPANCGDVSATLHDWTLGAVADATEVVTGHRSIDLRVVALLNLLVLVAAVGALVARLPGPGWVRMLTGLGVGLALADSGVAGARVVSLDPAPLAAAGLLLLAAGWLSVRRRMRAGRAVALVIGGALALTMMLPRVTPPEEEGGTDLAGRHQQLAAAVLSPWTAFDGVPTDGGPPECRLCVPTSLGNAVGGIAGVVLPLLWFAGARWGIELVRRSRRATDRDGRAVGEVLVLLTAVAAGGHTLAVIRGSAGDGAPPLVVASTVLLLPVVVTAGWHLVRVGALVGSTPGLLRRAGRAAARWLVVPVPATRQIPPPLAARPPAAAKTPVHALAGPFRVDINPSERERTP